MTEAATARQRGLVVLADGVQAAFAAGAVAELARGGVEWTRVYGAGLGAQVAVLAALGEAAEAERRWAREAENGSRLFRSQLAAARERLGSAHGVTLAPDPWTMDGWLDRASLAEHLAPELAAIPTRLARAGALCAVAVEDLGTGAVGWVELTGPSAEEAGALLRVAATFPGGWGPEAVGTGVSERVLWGGVGAALACQAPAFEEKGSWDIVCGFPVPTVVRGLGSGSLFEMIQRDQETRAGAVVEAWARRRTDSAFRVIAPGAATYRAWASRENAELGTEYPLPWERNAEVTAAILSFGASAARTCGPP